MNLMRVVRNVTRAGAVPVMALVSFFAAGLLAVAPVRAQADAPATVMIIGADKELGEALVAAYAGRGWPVIATVTNLKASARLAEGRSNVELFQLDVRDLDAIGGLAARLQSRPIDILIYAARLVGGEAPGGIEAQRPGQFDFAAFDEVMRVNATASLKVAEAFEANLKASRLKTIVKISSLSSSLSGDRRCNRCGNFFGKASDAAGNMIMRRLHQYHRGRNSGIVVGILDPGPVKISSMDELVADNFPANLMIPVEKSIEGMLRVIDGLNSSNSGSFMSYDGSTIPW